MAVGTAGSILTSPDQVTWTLRSAGTDLDLLGVTSGDKGVAVGPSGLIVTSP